MRTRHIQCWNCVANRALARARRRNTSAGCWTRTRATCGHRRKTARRCSLCPQWPCCQLRERQSPVRRPAGCALRSGNRWRLLDPQVYSNEEESIIEVCRPVMLNGIAAVATRQDLVDRTLHIDLEQVPEGRRRTEADMEAAFEQKAPGSSQRSSTCSPSPSTACRPCACRAAPKDLGRVKAESAGWTFRSIADRHGPRAAKEALAGFLAGKC